MCTGHFQDGSLALKHIFNQFVVSDSIFNQSSHAWGVGFIIEVFREQAKQMENVPLTDYKYNNTIFYISYDFNIFHTIIDLLKNATKYKKEETYKNLNKKKITFLMHITETDGLGHTYGPKADILRNHLIDLDKYFAALEDAFYEFYHDNRTTFLLTSDHGMNLNKYHGDDTEPCKRVPFMGLESNIFFIRYA
jgi:predicted AlkP superfamily pyrophosphatase or phosphodiesterase